MIVHLGFLDYVLIINLVFYVMLCFLVFFTFFVCLFIFHSFPVSLVLSNVYFLFIPVIDPIMYIVG